MSNTDDGSPPVARGVAEDVYHQYLLVSVPPSFVAILGYDSFGWLSVHPMDASTSVVRSGAVASDLSSYGDPQAREFTEAFFAEDKDMCERVQRGMYSNRAKGGQLVDMERIVVDFHRYLASRLYGTPRLPLYTTGHAALFETTGAD